MRSRADQIPVAFAEHLRPAVACSGLSATVVATSNSLPMLADHLGRHERQPKEEQQGHHDRVVKVPQDRDEVWDEVNRLQRICDATPQEDPGKPRSAWVAQNESAHT